jgi:D-glycero-alpha-D-manno-heptose-7-phosphate kinase
VIISRTPHRISFFGGGTDYPSYYREHGGVSLGACIDKYSYITCRYLPPFFEHTHRIVYSFIERVNSIDEIQHPSVRETIRYLKITSGLEIHHDGDIPARSGMGSSSAFTVGLLNSLLALEGRMLPRKDLATSAIHIEQEMIRENVGSQDQTFAAYGGFNRLDFLPNGEINVTPVIMKPERLARFESSLLLVFAGLSRNASEVAAEQIRNTSKNLDKLSAMKLLAERAYNILTSEHTEINEFGELLNETWQLKRELSSAITNDAIDNMHDTAMKNGATGGKLLGAGGGGFMLFYVPEAHRARLSKALGNYLQIPFRFVYEGSKIIVYEPDSQFRLPLNT